MTGNLDKPLGVSGRKPRNNSRNIRNTAIVGMVLLSGILGYFVSQTIGPGFENLLPGTTGNDVIKIAEPHPDRAKPGNKDDAPARRPDLPIDQDAPGLRPLNPDNFTQVPVVVPRKRPDNVVQKQVLADLPDLELVEKTSAGLLPKISVDGLRPFDVYSRQPDTEGNFGVARIVIIVGGLGISQTSSEQAIRKLPPAVTLAFAPYGNSLRRWMRAARKNGHELLMQIPMEPFGYPQVTAGDQAVLSSATKQQNIAKLNWALGRITNYVGVMNYLGGKIMTSTATLEPILEYLAERGLMFVDDGSIRNSLAEKTSKSTRLPFARAHLKIDATRTKSQIKKKLEELEAMAKRTGLAIGVATAFPDSIALIAQFLKNAKKRGLELTPVSAISTDPGL